MLPANLRKIIIFLIVLQGLYSYITTCYAQKLSFIPDQMEFKGDVVTKNNSVGFCTNERVSNSPDGSIILGINPKSCNPLDWKGGSATFRFNVQQQTFPVLTVLKISWPDMDGKGIHSQFKGNKIKIQLDGQTIWSKRIELLSSSNSDYYAAEHEPIQTTIVIRDSATHTITIITPENSSWDISNCEILFYDYPKSLKGIGYSPYRDCQYPGGSDQQQPTIENIKEDLIILSQTCNSIRTYSSSDINGKVPAIAKSLGLKVFAGVSIDGNFADIKKDNDEIDAVIALANEIQLEGIIVGNEYYYRHKNEADAINYLLGCINRVKEAVKEIKIPVLTAEISSEIYNPNYIPIIKSVDKIVIHSYPFWGGHDLNNAASQAIKDVIDFQQKLLRDFPDQNKAVILGETGWPSRGEQKGNAIPSYENQRKYLQEFLYSADIGKIDYLYFDAFNELWKSEEGSLGQHWGYSYSDRTAKYSFYGVLIPPDLIPVNNIDIPNVISTIEDSINSFKIYSEWPQKSLGIKVTDESIARITKHFSSDSLVNLLNKLKNIEFFSKDSFINSLRKDLPKADYEIHNNKSFTYVGNSSGYNNGNTYTETENYILKYSQYHCFFPRFMGDVDKIKMFECDRCNPRAGELSTKISFSFDGKNKWCGIYWLPMYDFESDEKKEIIWKNLPGVNIYKKLDGSSEKPIVLSFYARGEEGGEKVQFKFEGVRKRTKSIESRWLTLNKNWEQYTIDLSKADLSNVIGGFCSVSSLDKNPKQEMIQFYLDDIQYEYKDLKTPPSCNLHANFFESDFHLLQFFGDLDFRNTNFYESKYNGIVFSNETRLIFPRFNKFLNLAFPIPEPYITSSLNLLKDINWENRLNYGAGIEWRSLSTVAFLDNPLLNWAKQLRFYVLYLHSKYLQYEDSWDWRPTTDFRYGVELYKESNFYNTDLFWLEIWGDLSWRNTNFFVKDFNSWTFAFVPKVGIKLLPEREVCIMPYITGEISSTRRTEFWQNRILAGGGIRLMPFRWNDSKMYFLIKGLRLYVENLWLINYMKDEAPATISKYDIRFGINYAINWN